LAPLTDLCGKNRKFVWTLVEEGAFLKNERNYEQRNYEFDEPSIV
jgi:hypothetical protein